MASQSETSAASACGYAMRMPVLILPFGCPMLCKPDVKTTPHAART